MTDLQALQIEIPVLKPVKFQTLLEVGFNQSEDPL